MWRKPSAREACPLQKSRFLRGDSHNFLTDFDLAIFVNYIAKCVKSDNFRNAITKSDRDRPILGQSRKILNPTV